MHLKKVLSDQQSEQHRHNRHDHSRKEECDSGLLKPLNELRPRLDSYYRRKHAQTHVVEHPKTGTEHISTNTAHTTPTAKYHAGQTSHQDRAHTPRHFTDPNARQSEDRPEENPKRDQRHTTRVGRTDCTANQHSNAFDIALGAAY